MRGYAIGVILIAVIGCGGEVAGSEDGGDFDAISERATAVPALPRAPAAAEAPALPTPVTLAPCPSGWAVVAPDDPELATTCEPIGAPFVGCPADQMRLPGDAACRPIGDCGAAVDGFPTTVPSGDVRFVRPGATGGGTREAPFGAIEDALVGATASTTVVLSRGVHPGPATVTSGAHLLGVCAGDTTISSAVGETTLTFAGTGGALTGAGVSSADGGAAVEVAVGAEVAFAASELRGDLSILGRAVASRVSLRDGVATIAGDVEAEGLHGAGAELRVSGNVSIASAALLSTATALSLLPGGQATLEDAVIADGTVYGIKATGANLSLTDVLLTDIDDGAGAGGGIDVDGGTRASLERVRIRGMGDIALRGLGEETELTLDDVVIQDASRSNLVAGTNTVVAADIARFVARGLSIERTTGFALVIIRTNAVVMSDLSIFDVSLPPGVTTGGTGFIAGASRAVVDRALIRRATMFGIGAADHGQLRLTDVTVSETRPAGQLFGRGISVQSGAKVIVERFSVTDVVSTGVAVAGAGSLLTGSDLVVERTLPAPGGNLPGSGVGLHLWDGGSANLERVDVSESVAIGIILNTGASARLHDLVTREVATAEGAWAVVSGRCIDMGTGTRLVLERALVERCRDLGIGAHPGSVLELTDVTVRDVAPVEFDGSSGLGIYGTEDTRISGRRVLVEDTHQIGVGAFRGGRVVLEDLIVRRTSPADCAEGACVAGGVGLGVYHGAAMEVRRFEVRDNLLAGVQLASDGSLELEDGLVAGSPIGASVQVPDYDLGRISERVRYEDNGTNLDSLSLPVPEPPPFMSAEGDSE